MTERSKRCGAKLYAATFPSGVFVRGPRYCKRRVREGEDRCYLHKPQQREDAC